VIQQAALDDPADPTCSDDYRGLPRDSLCASVLAREQQPDAKERREYVTRHANPAADASTARLSTVNGCPSSSQPDQPERKA
jgi:hypothetical protein